MADRPKPRLSSRVPVMAALGVSLQGCALRGAPSYELFGAYFPLWLLSGLIGIVGAVIAHRLFVATGLAEAVPFQLFVNSAIGVAIAVLVWMLGTGQIL